MTTETPKPRTLEDLAAEWDREAAAASDVLGRSDMTKSQRAVFSERLATMVSHARALREVAASRASPEEPYIGSGRAVIDRLACRLATSVEEVGETYSLVTRAMDGEIQSVVACAVGDKAAALEASLRASPEEGRAAAARARAEGFNAGYAAGYDARSLRSPPEPTTTEDEGRGESAEGWIPARALKLLRDHFTLAVYPSPGMVSPRVEAVRVRVTILPGAPASSKEGERHG